MKKSKESKLIAMLEHQKIVLSGVCDDKPLFRKELRKSLTWLNSKERDLLEKWVRENFYHMHADIIDEVFRASHPVAS